MKAILNAIAALVTMLASYAQVPYGSNPAAGSYFNTRDTKYLL
jgi:hypothetical protein